MNFFHETGKKCIAGCQVLRVSTAHLISGRMIIVHRVCCLRLTAIFDDHAIMRIDVVIILTVVLVIGRRDKQRIEIDHFNSQILQIIQLVPHALKITAVEAAHIHGRRIGAPVGYLMYRTPNIDILTFRHIVALVTVAETVHKDLVHDRALCPLRRMKSRRNTKCIAALNIHSCAQTVKIADCAALHHLEIIALRLTVRLHAILVIVKQAVRRYLPHLRLYILIFLNIKNLIDIIFCCAKPESYRLTCVRFLRVSVILRLIRKQCLPVYFIFLMLIKHNNPCSFLPRSVGPVRVLSQQ